MPAPQTISFAELVRLPETQEAFRQDRFRTGYTGDINQWVRDQYRQNAGSNPFQIADTYNAATYNNPDLWTEYTRSQTGITPEHARSWDQWLTGFVTEKPEDAAQMGLITSETARNLSLMDEVDRMGDPDLQAELDLHRRIRSGELGSDIGGGGIPMIGYTPINWEDAQTPDDIPYHLVDWQDLNVDDLIAAIHDTESIKEERIRGITELNAARDAAVQSRKEAIEQGLQETQNQILRDRTRGGFVANSSQSDANLLKATVGARQNTALEDAATRVENLKAMAEGRFANESLDYTAGVQVGEVGRDRDTFNLQGQTSVNLANQDQKGRTDQHNSGQRNQFTLFNTSGRNDTNRINTTNRLHVDSTNASNAGANAARGAAAAEAALNRQINSAARVNAINQNVLDWNPSTASTPSYVIYTPQGTMTTTQNPSEMGATWQKVGAAGFGWALDGLEDYFKNRNNTPAPVTGGTGTP